MTSRSAVGALWLCGLLAVAGCPPMNASPAARPTESDPDSSAEPSEIVDATGGGNDVRPAADEQSNLDEVRQWVERIQRVDDVRSRIAPQPLDPTVNPYSEETYAEDPAVKDGGDPAPPPTAPVEEPPADSGPAAVRTTRGSAAPGASVPESEAPVLGAVTARAVEPPAHTLEPRSGSLASVNTPAEAAAQPLTIQQFADQWLSQSSDPSFRSQLDQRLLLVLAGEYEQARQPIDMVSDQQRQMAEQFVEALISIREGHGGSPEEETNRVLDRLEQLQQSLLEVADLRIPTLVLTRAVHGFGRYEALEPPQFLSGRETEFVVYCEVKNFVSRLKDDGRYESLFSMRTAILNRAGDVVLDLQDDHVPDICQTRRQDCFIPRLVRLPATLSPGEYVAKVTIVDKIGAKVAEKRATFRIVARS